MEINMIGKRFGKLVVLEKAPKNPQLKSRCTRYICKCDCGRIVEVNGNSLRTGHTTTCGKCSRKGVIKDLTGETYGVLTVVERVNGSSKDRRALWKCQCECGNTVVVVGKDLKDGHKKSCGCLKESLGELKVERLLKEMGLSYQKQYKFKDCKKQRELPFDFAVFENGKLLCVIEYQGDIHFITTGGWNSEKALQERKIRDSIKKDFCKENNIKLVELPYYDYDKIDKDFLKEVIFDD